MQSGHDRLVATNEIHAVLGEATDHFTQSEVQQLDGVLGEAANPARGGTSSAGASEVTSLLSIVPGMGPLAREAENLQRSANAQAQSNSQASSGHGLTHPGNQSRSFLGGNQSFAGPPGSVGGPPGPGVPGMSQNFDPVALIQKIYPILEFRDKVVRAISGLIETVPGLESILEKISETITMFVMSLLAPFIRPIINAVSEQLQSGSSLVIDASGKQQYEVWTNPHCSDPTHSLLSKDHFANMLNPPAGAVAASIVRYVAPRVLYAWEHPDIVVDEILHDVTRVFHHPVLRDNSCALHRDMFSAVQEWVHQQPNRGSQLNDRLSSDGVRQGQNLNKDKPEPGHLGGLGGIQALQSGHGGFTKSFLGGSSWGGGASTRELLEEDDGPFRGAMDQDFGYGRTSQPSGGFQGTGYSSHSGAARTESAYHTQQGQYHSEYVGGGCGAYNDTAAAQTSALFGGGPRYNDPVGGSNYGSNANYYGSGGGGGGGQQYGSGDNRQQFGGSGGDYGQTGRRPEERFGETGEQFRPQSGHKHHKKKDSSDDSDGSDGGSGRKEKHKHQHDHKNQHDHKQNKGESYGNEAGYGREAYGRGQNHGGQGYSTGGGSNQPGQQHGGNVPGSFGGEGYGEARYPDDRQAGQEGYYGGGGYNQPPGGGGGGGGGNGGGGGDDDVDEYGQRRQQGYGGGGNNDYGGGSNY